MNQQEIIGQLAQNAQTFERLLAALTPEEVRWKPAPEKWSLLEVVNHLLDEEKLDFRYRLRSILEDPKATWPPIDPENWVVEKGYADRDYDVSVSSFLKERQESIVWLQGLKNPDWQATYIHEKAGAISAAMMLANWLAHDYLHIRQIIALKYGFLAHSVAPVSLEYAG